MLEPRWANTSGARGRPGVGFMIVRTLGAAEKPQG